YLGYDAEKLPYKPLQRSGKPNRRGQEQRRADIHRTVAIAATTWAPPGRELPGRHSPPDCRVLDGADSINADGIHADHVTWGQRDPAARLLARLAGAQADRPGCTPDSGGHDCPGAPGPRRRGASAPPPGRLHGQLWHYPTGHPDPA